MAGNFLTLEEVLQELQIDKAELDAMISQGKLRRLRDGGVVKFRKDEVAKLKKVAETDATVVFEAGSKPQKDEETADDRIFDVLKDDAKHAQAQTVVTPPSDADEAAKARAEEKTISDSDIAPAPAPEKPAEKEKSDSDIDSAIFDEEETSKVEVQLAGKEEAEDDSDQTSIIPAGAPVGPAAKTSDEEESVFDFGDEKDSAKPGEESSSSDILPPKKAAGADTGEATIALEPDSSSDILEAESDSSAEGADTGDESSSDILDLAVEDSATESAVDLDAGAKDSDAVTDLIELSKEEKSDSTTAEVEVDESSSADVKAGDVSDDVLTVAETDTDSRPTPPTDVAERRGEETADTIDLTLSDTSTAKVEEAEEGEEAGKAGGPALLEMKPEGEKAEEAEAPAAEEAEEAEEPAEAPAGAVAAELPYVEAPSPAFTVLLAVASVVSIFSGVVLYNTVRCTDLPITKWATDLALNLLSKK